MASLKGRISEGFVCTFVNTRVNTNFKRPPTIYDTIN